MTLLDELQKAVELYHDDKLLQSARLIANVKEQVERVLNNPEAIAKDTEYATKVNNRLQDDDLRCIASEVAEVELLKKSLHSKAGWTLSYNGTQTKVWYRRETDKVSHSMLVEGQIRAPLLNLAALLYEADLYSELLWFVQKAVILKEAGRLRRAAYFDLYTPWPMYNREIAVYGYAVDGLDDDDNCVLVMSRSLRDSDGIPIPEQYVNDDGTPRGRAVRAHLHFSGYELTPINPDITAVRFVFNADPQLSFIPTPLVNWASLTLCRWSLRAMESRARQLPPMYEQRMKSKPIYDWFQSRLVEYWTLKGKADEYVARKSHSSDEHRLSDNFDVDAVPDGPSRSVLMSIFAAEARSNTQADTTSPMPRKPLSARLFARSSLRE